MNQALLPFGDGSFYLLMKVDLMKKLGIVKGQTCTVEIEPDNSKYELPVPEEFQVVLDQDEEAIQIFEKLSPGKQRSLLYIAGNVKNPQKRIERALAIAHHLTRMKGELDYKELQKDLKQFRE